MTSINEASSAYSNALNQIKQSPNLGSGETSASTFGDLVKNSLSSAIDAQHKSEQVSAAAIAGQADMTDVLQAINDAELALNTVLAVRDKVVQAYEQVIHTPM